MLLACVPTRTIATDVHGLWQTKAIDALGLGRMGGSSRTGGCRREDNWARRCVGYAPRSREEATVESIDGSSKRTARNIVHHGGVVIEGNRFAPTARFGISHGTTQAPVAHESAGIRAFRAAQESSPRSSRRETRRPGCCRYAYCLLRDGDPHHQHRCSKLQCFSPTGVG